MDNLTNNEVDFLLSVMYEYKQKVGYDTPQEHNIHSQLYSKLVKMSNELFVKENH